GRLVLAGPNRELAEDAVRGHVDDGDVAARLGGDPRAGAIRSEGHGPGVFADVQGVEDLPGLGVHDRYRVVRFRGDVELRPISAQPDALGLDAHGGRTQ